MHLDNLKVGELYTLANNMSFYGATGVLFKDLVHLKTGEQLIFVSAKLETDHTGMCVRYLYKDIVIRHYVYDIDNMSWLC